MVRVIIRIDKTKKEAVLKVWSLRLMVTEPVEVTNTWFSKVFSTGSTTGVAF